MRLPNAERAVIEEVKIAGYLLNKEHRFGASKARFFAGFGFHIDQWEQLAQALREHGQRYEAVQTDETGFGPRFTVEGELISPDGRHPTVRSVWQIDEGSDAPRLITAYPVEDGR